MKVVKKPWGDFKQFVLNKKCTVKILSVKPKGVLSLQKHKNRSEMWYFLTSGFMQIGNKKRKVKKGEVVKAGRNVAHKIYAGLNKVEVLEISLGEFDENDIVRLEDKYGRNNGKKRRE